MTSVDETRVETRLLEPIQKLGRAFNLSARNLEVAHKTGLVTFRCWTNEVTWMWGLKLPIFLKILCYALWGLCDDKWSKAPFRYAESNRCKKQWERRSSCFCFRPFPSLHWSPGEFPASSEALVRFTFTDCSSVPWGTSNSLKQISLQRKHVWEGLCSCKVSTIT